MGRNPTYEVLKQKVGVLEREVEECKLVAKRTAELKKTNEELRQEITERKKSERKLRENEERLNAFYNAAFEGIAIIEKGRFLEVNTRFAKLFGYERNELIGSDVMNLVDEEDRALVSAHIKSGYEKPYEHRAVHKDGSRTFVEVNGKQTRYQGRKVRVTAIHDIGERRRAEEALKDSEERLSHALDAGAIGLFDWDIRNDQAQCTDRYYSLFGMEPGGEMLAEAEWIERVHPEDRARAEKEVKLALENEKPYDTEYRIILPNKSIRWVSSKGKVFYDRADNPFRMIGTMADITVRKETEETVRKSEEMFRALFEFAPDAYYLNDFSGKIIDGNRAAEKLFGYKKEELIGKNILELDLLSQNELAKAGGLLAENIKGKSTGPDELVLIRKSGKAVTAEIRTFPVNIGRQPIVLGIARDVSDRKRLEKQLRQAQRMEAIGTLAGGIAHDFNNILQSIFLNIELAQYEYSTGSFSPNRLEEALNSCERAKDLVMQILTFSREAEQEIKPLDIRLVIKEGLKMLRASLPSTIEIKQDLEKGPAMVLSDPAQMHQIILNLGTNAGHAMRKKGGVLEVGLNNVSLDSKTVAQYPDLKPGDYVKLVVGDTGQGMDPMTMERIFDPFFTTKDRGEGTGMGLSVVHGIVKNFEGSITAESEPGRGTKFEIFLPTIGKQATPKHDAVTPFPRGTERILIVDDEPSIIDVLKRALGSLGYETVSRNSSIDALEAFRSQPEKFDLIITDQTMPKMTGTELVAELRNIRTDIPVILCSGFSEMITEEQAKVRGIRELLMKPIVMRDLANVVRKSLDKK